MRFNRISTKVRMFTVLIILLLSSFMSISVINYHLMKSSIRDELLSSSLPLVRDLIYWDIRSQLQDPMQTSSVMANDTFLIDWINEGEKSTSAITDYLSKIRERYDYASTFFVSADTGNYYSYSGLHKVISRQQPHDLWYYDFIATGEQIALDVDTDEVKDGRLTIFINVRVSDTDGRLLGVTGVGLNMDSIVELLHETQHRYGRTIYLVDRYGDIQAHSDLASLGERPEYISRVISQRNEHDIADEYTDTDGTMLYAATYLDQMDWFIVVEQDLNQSLEMAKSTLYRNLLVGFIISLFIIAFSLMIIHSYQKEIEEASIHDYLTGISSRMYIESMLEVEIERAKRYGHPLSILLLDVDYFKSINDTYGHLAGDEILKEFSRLLRTSIRKSDIVGRWGGDEFMILLPYADADAAMKLGEHLRKHIREHQFSRHIMITSSIGTAASVFEDTQVSLIKKADNALYRAKRSGKDCVSS